MSEKPNMSGLDLFSLVPKRGASVGDIGKSNASNSLVRLRAHEQQLVATPGQRDIQFG